MKLMVTLAFILLSFISLAQETEQDSIADSDRIYWNEWYRIEWDDFEAEPEETKKIAALSSIALPYSYHTDGEGFMLVKVNVCFLKNKSWSVKERQNNVLLQHEQLHFNIAELHRRLIVKAITEAEFTKKNYKEKLNAIIDKYWIEGYRKMQDRYDAETNYSRMFRKQIDWNKYVAQQLRNLEEYTFTDVEVSLINFD